VSSRYVTRILPFTLGLVAGGSLLAGLLVLVRQFANPIPGVIVVAGAALAAAAALRLLPAPPSSPWRVPRGWNTVGQTRFALVFGLILGFGLLTAVSTAGFYVVVLFALYAEPSAAVLVIMAFIVGRAVPSHIAVLPAFRADVTMFTWRLARVLRALRPAEAAPLVALAVALLA
jgi:hypothetical protein